MEIKTMNLKFTSNDHNYLKKRKKALKSANWEIFILEIARKNEEMGN